MEREYISIEDIIASAQGSINNFSINGRFLITSVIKKTTINGKPYFNITLKDKTGNLNAKRFTSGESEFESLNNIYLLGNIVELEGIYQYEWDSVKIAAEKLIKSFIKELPHEIQDENVENFLQKNLALLKNQKDKFDELIKIIEFEVTILIKLYINDVIKPIFENPSNRKIKELKKSTEQHIEGWSENKREEFINEYSRTIKRYEDLQPSKWKKWISCLIRLISVLRS